MNILDLLVEKQLSNGCVSFIVEDATDDVLAIFYGEDPSTVWDAAADYNNENYVGEIETSLYKGSEKIGICVGEFNETTDTNYFEVK